MPIPNEDQSILPVLASPDSGARLAAAADGTLTSFDGAETFPVENGILYLLPRDVVNRTTKEQEREGWRRVFEEHQWKPDGRTVLEIMKNRDDPYWVKVSRAFELVMQALPDLRGKVGVDLACGMGWAAAHFTRHGARMIACDFNDTEYNGLGFAVRARDLGVHFTAVCSDSEAIPIADGSVDFVFICSALHHFTRPERTLAEVHRILKPGGVLIDICESFLTGLGDRRREESHDVLVEFREAGINELAYTHGAYLAMFGRAGFRVTSLMVGGWDSPTSGSPPEEWINRGLADRARHHGLSPKGWVFRLAALPPLGKLLRWAKLRFSIVDRVYLCRKPA